MSDLEIPQTLSSERQFDGRMIGVRVDTLRTPDGVEYMREVVEYGQAVVLVPLDEDGRILMVRQYRHAVGEWLLELPAGGIDEHDESPLAAAMRELREETGHRGSLLPLGRFFLAPGYSDELQHIFAAYELVEDPLEPDADEDLRLERVPLDDALRLIDTHTIRDAKSIAALMLFMRSRSR